MKRRNSDEFTLIHAMIVCGVVAIIAIITTAFLSPVQPALTLETICIDHVRFVVGPDGHIRQMLDQGEQGIACQE